MQRLEPINDGAELKKLGVCDGTLFFLRSANWRDKTHEVHGSTSLTAF